VKNNPVYIPEQVQAILDFYGPLLDITNFRGKINEHLIRITEHLFQGIQQRDGAVWTEVSNYHPDYLGKPISRLEERELNLQIARQTIASEYGFNSWQVLAASEVDYDPMFELAIFWILKGDLPALEKHLTGHPELLIARSNYGHAATLLHYTANNGVEIWRQVVPPNLPDIAKLLIDLGVDKNAAMSVYGGNHTPYELAASSAHPYNAGITTSLLSVLR